MLDDYKDYNENNKTIEFGGGWYAFTLFMAWEGFYFSGFTFAVRNEESRNQT